MRRRLAVSAVLLLAVPAFAQPAEAPPTATPTKQVHRGGGGTRRAGRAAMTPAATTAGAVTNPNGSYAPASELPEGGPTPHAEGQYGGVPDAAHAPATDAKHKGRHPSKGTLSWIGFEPKNGGAEVFFQSAAPFAVAQTVEGGTLVVMLTGLTRQVANTRRPIDTHFFDNPVASISARAVGAAGATRTHAAHAAGIEVRIAFKNAKDAKEASVRASTEADGLYYAYLDFPEGADAGATQPTMADPETP
jgi:hypothetical protein